MPAPGWRPRGLVPSAGLLAFVAEHIARFGTMATARRLNIRLSTLQRLRRAERIDVKTMLRVASLRKRLGHDRQLWHAAIPTDPPKWQASKPRRRAVVPPPVQAVQHELFG